MNININKIPSSIMKYYHLIKENIKGIYSILIGVGCLMFIIPIVKQILYKTPVNTGLISFGVIIAVAGFFIKALDDQREEELKKKEMEE